MSTHVHNHYLLFALFTCSDDVPVVPPQPPSYSDGPPTERPVVPTSTPSIRTIPPLITPSPTHPGLCPVDRTCAHYHGYGVGRGSDACCPKCRQTISVCPNVVCEPVRGCLRYARVPAREGDCCLPCERVKARTGSKRSESLFAENARHSLLLVRLYASGFPACSECLTALYAL